ncbi:transcription factor grauzone-like [Condylostylus longicornis]|uniref:transcription factor grauzone-like n=1 Tax=Condylostylus longicornis TaxID=2530218 RepID=UPI00244E0CD1|nr:transcription factor grauzone-like [Condylostylus longicornis]
MICRLCLEYSNNGFNIFNENEEEKICDIIEKYFWFKPDEKDSHTNFICETCWNVIKNFHILYEEVEKKHKNLNLLKKDLAKFDDNDEFQIKHEYKSLTLNKSVDDLQPFNSDNVHISAPNFHWEEIKCKDEENSTDGFVSIEETDQLNCQNRKKLKKKVTPTARKKTSKKATPEAKQKSSAEKTGNRFHEEDKMITNFIKMACDICSKEERNFSNLKRHFKSVHNENGYVICCNKKFFKRSWLVDHIGKHLNPESFKCSICGKTCNSRRTLKGHIFRMHESDPNDCYQCAECGKAFKHKDVLTRHALIHIPEEQKKFKCEQCGKTYPVQSLLFQHIRIIHDKRYAGTCDICGKTYTNKEDANRHRMTVHEGVKKSKVKCKICSEEFSTKYQYYNHKTEVHGDPNKKVDNTCRICNKISANSEALKRHVEKVHKRIAKFHCTFCDKQFKTELSLKEHTATHTGEPLYICPHCPKTFTHNANMHHHRKHAHPTEFEVAKQWKESKKQPWTQLTSITK